VLIFISIVSLFFLYDNLYILVVVNCCAWLVMFSFTVMHIYVSWMYIIMFFIHKNGIIKFELV
jgi:hypothetical protein